MEFLNLFVKLAFQTNKKLSLKNLRASTAASSNFPLQNNQKHTFGYFNNPFF
jgi:hypothetical protein